MAEFDQELAKQKVRMVPASDLLLETGRELRALAENVDEMESLIGNLIVAGAFGGSQSVYQLQYLDHLRQSLGGIADFLEAISKSLPDHHIDALAATASLTLCDLSRRLSRIQVELQCGDEQDAGDYLAFENVA